MFCGAGHIDHLADRLHGKSGAPGTRQHQVVRFPDRERKNNPYYPLSGTGNLKTFKSLLASSG